MDTYFKWEKKGIYLAHPVSRKRSSVPFALSLNFLLARAKFWTVLPEFTYSLKWGYDYSIGGIFYASMYAYRGDLSVGSWSG